MHSKELGKFEPPYFFLKLLKDEDKGDILQFFFPFQKSQETYDHILKFWAI